MKLKLLSSLILFLFLQASPFALGQVKAEEAKRFTVFQGTPTLMFGAPDRAQLLAEDELRDKEGQLYRIAVATFTDITQSNSGSWVTDKDGNRTWQLHIRHERAEALSFLFQTFKIYDGTTFNIFDNSGRKLHSTLTQADVAEHFQQNAGLCFGDEMTLEIREPKLARASEIFIDRIMYNYRGTGNPVTEKDFDDSGSCEINVNCSPAGDSWQDEKRGIARIYVVDGGLAGWCTGSLVNNLAQNCKPYFLTAQHCGVGVSQSDLNQWIFNFGYEAPGCSDPSDDNALNVSSKRITGCVILSNSQGVTGQNTITSSDFILLQLGTLATEAAIITKLKTAAINAYWNGWDARNTPSTGGAGIHHPAGDIKKISTYNGTLVSTNYSPGASNTHWRVTWTSNANGHGVTEGGSSGSPIFNTNGGSSRIVGTLSGGSSYCNALNSPDLYGKMSYHWASNGTTSNRQMKPFLDPNNTGLQFMDGSSNPCFASPTAPVANFIGTPVTVTVGGTVAFTDQSTNAPTSWSWSIFPATGWSYTGGTSAASQNPQVMFSVQGQYTVSLTAANAAGSDTETKTNYITVTIVSGPCTATSTDCEEYIYNVSLESINNTTSCTNYASYTAQTTTLFRGQQYQLTIIPYANGSPGTAIIDDEIAAWIDFNHDFDFTDEGERIGYALVAQNWNNVFTFTVPETSATGVLKMRVRMSYLPDDGAINPCGTSQYGEVEDYNVTILSQVTGIEENGLFRNILVFPNPAKDKLTVDLSGIDEDVSMELIDVTGKVVLRRINTGNSEVVLDLTGLANGSYQLLLRTAAGSSVRKIIKL